MRRALALLALAACAADARGPADGLWHDPGDVAALDFGGTAGAPVHPPQPPFRFLREDPSGTQPKLFVKDGAGATWNVKFGYEVKNESFCWRPVRACGYFAEPGFFVPQGQVQGMLPLRRRADSLQPDGRFTAARFQFRDPALKFIAGANWRWDRPPLAGTRELNGLKVLIMLFSNWDNKDARAGKGGPNTAIFQWGPRRIYAFTDWGAGMGRWGSSTGQTDWRCEDYTAQTPDFVKGVEHGRVNFGWEGDITNGFRDDIPPAHVAWLMQYLGRITDAQFTAGLKAAGATDVETACFGKALRNRIEQLRAVSRSR